MSLLSESTTCGAVIVLLQLKVEKLVPFPFGSNKKRFEMPDRTIMFDVTATEYFTTVERFEDTHI